MEKINCVLLVDDRPTTNFFNKKIISLCGNVEHVKETKNGKEALNYILKQGAYAQKNIPKPNIILLDVNMPVMDGFEFVEKIGECDKEITQETLIVLLTTSNWSRDKNKALKEELIHDFLEKPLTKEKFNKIADYYKTTYAKE